MKGLKDGEQLAVQTWIIIVKSSKIEMEDDNLMKLKQILAQEAVNSSRANYSSFRSNRSKWGILRLEPTQTKELELINAASDLYISVQTRQYIDSYPISSVRARVSIKRNFDYFASVYFLWLILNPFHLKGISYKVWLKFNEFLYREITNFPDSQLAESIAQQDTKADFADTTALYFCDFYDSFFEYLDCNCKSKLVSEYARLVKRIKVGLARSTCFDSVSLHSKKHLKDSLQASFASWMLAYIKEIKKPANMPAKNEVTFVKSTPASRPITHLSKRFQQRISSPKAKRLHSGKRLINLKLERMNSEPGHSYTNKTKTPTSPMSMSARIMRPGLQRITPRYRPEYLDIISPLSKLRLGSRKEIGLLEEVIEVRRSNAKSQSTPGIDSEIYNTSPRNQTISWSRDY
mmetsp:Transcript_19179/g.35029  ORF Transcript_19179/g.35029 Transcript_19179/m.35029 type:complete len:405 (-) Transcript_19179:62-1276(-)